MFPKVALYLARFCQEAGIEDVVISPGSRSAPLVLAFSRNDGFRLHSQMDERSAGFQALGLALGTRKPVAIICTSGTAVLNYGPAIAEAFYQQVPLLVFTADRPTEAIDQWDGQAIRQKGIFANHTKFWAEMPSLENTQISENHAVQLMNQAFFEATAYPNGPVHLNFPFREPFYPKSNEELHLKVENRLALTYTRQEGKLDPVSIHRLSEIFCSIESRMVLIGQNLADKQLNNSLLALSEYGHIVVGGDFLNNIFEHKSAITHFDWIKDDWEPAFFPEILITLGTGLLSKKLRKQLKSNPPRHHWHVSPSGFPGDPLGSITEVIHCEPSWFLSKLAETVYFQNPKTQEGAREFQNRWVGKQRSLANRLEARIEKEAWSDFVAVFHLVNLLPERARFFIGNSMPVRYWNALTHLLKREMQAFGNRGTSGIDGCISTAVGLAMALPNQPLITVVGDISFFYDRNGLWVENLPKNLKIMVLNNGGGNIFRILPDSGKLPELEPWFEMNQKLSAQNSARDFNLAYYSISASDSCDEILKAWLAEPGPALVECFTDKEVNQVVFSNCQSACNE